MADIAPLPSVWNVLAQALISQQTVSARYHGHPRLLCPHLLGWKNGRPKVLAYQAGGTTSNGDLASRPEQRWRSLFVDELEDAITVPGHPWHSAHNYSSHSNCVDQIALRIEP